MDITESIKSISVGNGALDIVRRRALPVLGAVVLAYALWDIYVYSTPQSPEESRPAIQYLFPRFYMWLFGAFAVALVWGTMKAIRAPIWRLAAAAAFLLMMVLAVIGTPDSFPFYASGQDQHAIEGQRVREIDNLSFGLLAVEVTPASLDNKVDDVVGWMVDNWKAFFRGLSNNLLKIMVPMNNALQEMPMWLFITISALAAWRVSGYRVAALTVVWGCSL